MKTLKTIGLWLRDACVWFSAVSLALILLNLILFSDGTASAIDSVRFLLLFPFSLCASAAGLISQSGKIPRWARVLLHYLIVVVAAMCFLWLPSVSGVRGVTVLIMLVLFTIIYWILFGLVHLIRKRIRLLLEEN